MFMFRMFIFLLHMIRAIFIGVVGTAIGVAVCSMFGKIIYDYFFLHIDLATEHGFPLSAIDTTNLTTIIESVQRAGASNQGAMIGIICGLLIGVGGFFEAVDYAFKRERLGRIGQPVSALVTHIEKKRKMNPSSSNNSFNSFNNYPQFTYIVHAEWIDPATGNRHYFKRKMQSSPATREGKYVTVQVNPQNYQDYHMQL